MRLINLQLERFGPFTGQSLAFRPAAQLHVVYGRNEAGKSCALAALTDLLFGIERQTTYDFLHEGKDLRVGAIIADRAGQQLKFRRRKGKGNKNTLLSADAETPLPDDALAWYLGAITREVFCNAFGLNSGTLRSGAEEMLKSEGQVGATLFAAASGLRGLTELRKQLDVESNSVFAPRASKDRTFYQALDRFEQARRTIRDRELKAGQWKVLNERIDGLSHELDVLKHRRNDNGTEHARLSRLRRVAPQIALIDDDVRHLNDLGKLPDVESGFSEELEERLKTRDDAILTRDRTVNDERRAMSNHSAIKFDDGPLARAEEIVQLFSELGAYTKARSDILIVEREVQGFAGQLTELAARLGLPDARALEKMRPNDAALALVRALIAEGNKTLSSIAANDPDLANERETLAELEQQAIARGKAIDPKPFGEKFAALTPALRQLEKRDDLAATVTKLSRQLNEATNRLKPSLPTDVGSLAMTKLPGPETIARFRKAFETIDKERDRLKDRLAETTQATITLEQRLTSLATDRPIPTPEAVAGQRAQRDSIWQRLRSTLFGASDALAGAALVQTTSEFERSSVDADRLSDEALGDASRIAEFGAVERQLLDAQRGLKELQKDLLDLESRRTSEWTAYVTLWGETGVSSPLPPSEMAAWLESVSKLLDRREEIDDTKLKLGVVHNAIEAVVPILWQLSSELGLDELKGRQPASVVSRLEHHFREMGETWSERREFDANLRGAKDRVARLSRQQKQLEERHQDWLLRWAPAMAAISVPSATIEQAQAALDVWQAVPGAVRERDDRAARVAAMRQETTDFSGRASALVTEVSPDLARLSPDAALKRLNEQLSEAAAANTRRSEAGKYLKEATANRQAAEAALSEANNALGHLVSRLPSNSDLPDVCRRLKSRDKLLESLARLKSQLLSQADGQSEDELRTQITNFDPDVASGTLKNLEIEDEQLDLRAKEIFSAHRQALAEREALEQGVGAEIAAVQRRSAEAELVSAAREWSVLKLGSLLLGTAIERQRTSQQDPLMLRAGQLFATITGGSFSGLGQEFDDEDVPKLIGRRPTGDHVHVAAMSEGARDQLYLALRLAYLEDYGKRAEPIPFLGDDLFMTFDDDRTKLGLTALAGLSDDVQPILFTHHRHVVELAQQAVGDGLDVMELA